MIEDTINKLTTAVEALTVAITKLGAEQVSVRVAETTMPEATMGSGGGVSTPPAPIPVPAPTPVSESDSVKKRTRRTKEQIAADNAAKLAATTPTTENPAPAQKADLTAPPKPTVGLNDVRELAQKLLDAGLVEQVRAVYQKLGGKGLGDIKPEQYPDVIVALQEVLDAHAAPQTPAATEDAPEEDAPEETETPTVTKEDMIALAVKLRDAGHTEAKIRPILAKAGLKKISDTPPDRIAEVHALLAKAVQEVEAA